MRSGWARIAVIAGSIVLLGAMAVTWVVADLETAGWIASVVGAVVGVGGLAFALLGGGGGSPSLGVRRTGNATATDGGRANTGIRAPGASPPTRAHVTHSGDARADGQGSDANSGIDLT
ncbi:hypothetical protein ACTWP5_26045 [Streptomyces sp. 4N509B]|uniref:hypothetical protein n=1 Tax=Streptomyces sp. 4N509B TaxID=3457413 RepID=UPI003FD2298C